MELDKMNLEDIIRRLAELDEEVRSATDIGIVNKAIEDKPALLERKAELQELEQRKQSALDLQTGKVEGKKIDERGEMKNMENILDRDSAEYRSAFLNSLREVELNEVEQRAYTTVTASAGAVIPTTTVNSIIEIVKQHAPLLSEIDLYEVPGGVSVPLEDVINEAISHVENATITPAVDKLKAVNLFGYEVVKLLQISKSVKKMSIDAFENWLTNSLGKAIANKISSLILTGAGATEAAGLSTLTFTTVAGNAVEVAKAVATTGKNITDLISLLPGGYDANAKFLMSKKTLFQDVMNLQDASKNDLVTKEGNQYFIYGYPVMLDERVAISDAYLGDFFAGYKANMPEDVSVVSGFDIDSNSYKYLGSAIFDGKPAVASAFVKLVKKTV